jgi:hypothetical protein
MEKLHRRQKQDIAVVWESVPDADPDALARAYELLWQRLYRDHKNPRLTKKDNPLLFNSERNQ